MTWVRLHQIANFSHDPSIIKVWGAEAQRYAWRNRDRLLLRPPALISHMRVFYGKREITRIILWIKALFQSFKCIFFT